MYHRILAIAAAAAAAGTLPVAAQREAPRRERVRERVEVRGAGPETMDFVFNRRARLGVKVTLQALPSDSAGASIDGVVPGGPADEAGLRAGDVITKLDGASLVRGGSGPHAGADRSLPGMRLIELAARLEPNDTVEVEYLRDGARKTARLVTNDEPNFFRFPGPGMPGADEMGPGEMRMMGPGLDHMAPGGHHFEFFYGPLARLELAPLNADLGQYFGTTDGVLVISVPKGSPLGLRGGDVVQAVDGRKASSPAQLLRILRSYDAGDTLKLDVLRNRKRDTVTGHMPGKPERGQDKGRERDHDKGGDGADS
jgi:predicted metalloprotease with PDZ domain